MKLSKIIMMATAAVAISIPSGARASSHYDGGCAQLHFADEAQATPAVKTELATQAPVMANPVVEGAKEAQADTDANSEKLQQARFQHHETAGAVDCDLDAIED